MPAMPSDKNEPIRITGYRFVGRSVVLVDLIKSVKMNIYTASESVYWVKSALWWTREKVEDLVANLLCLPDEKPEGILTILSR